MNELTERMLRAVGILMLRIGGGALLITHGWGKLKLIVSGQWWEADPIGLGPHLSLVGVTFAEFFCALFVALGILTRPAAVVVVFNMIVAALVIHGGDPFAKKEMALLYVLIFAVLVFTGGGRFSLDALIFPAIRKRRERRKIAAKVAAKA
jgi:putative oxidoreductase